MDHNQENTKYVAAALDRIESATASDTSSSSDQNVLPQSRHWKNTGRLLKEQGPRGKNWPTHTGTECAEVPVECPSCNVSIVTHHDFRVAGWQQKDGSMNLVLKPLRLVRPAPSVALSKRILTLVRNHPGQAIWSLRELQQYLRANAKELREELQRMTDDGVIVSLPSRRADMVRFRLTTGADWWERFAGVVSICAEQMVILAFIEKSGFFNVCVSGREPRRSRVTWRT